MKPCSMPIALLQHVGDRREAVGGAGGVGDDDVVAGQLVVVDAVDDGEVGAVGRAPRRARAWRRPGDAPRPSPSTVKMPVHSSAMSTLSVLPGQLGRVLDRRHLDRAAADVDRVAGDLHLVRETAVHGVVAQQVGVGLDRAEVVDADDLDVLAAGLDDGAEDVAPDAAEAVDANPDGHALVSCAQAQLRRALVDVPPSPPLPP